MLAGTFVFAVLLSWAGHRHRLASHRHRLASLCGNAGWRVCYEFEFDENAHWNIAINRANNSVVMPTPHGPEFLRKSLGLAYFNRVRGVTGINLNTESDHRLFEQLSSQPSITFLRVFAGGLTWRDFEAISALPNLKSLHIEEGAWAGITADEVRRLEEMHPEWDLYIRRLEPPPE